MKKILWGVCALFVGLAFSTTASAQLKFAVLAQRGVDTAIKEFEPLMEYLSAQMGEKITLVPLKFTEIQDWWQVNPDGVMLTNPWFYVRAKVTRGAKALVTVNYVGSKGYMSGVIFTKKDSGIQSLQDLRGKVVMVPKLSSPGGWLFQKGEIVKAGIVPERDFKLLLETPDESHDQVVYAVRDGKADAGTVRTNLLEAMHREGKINMNDFLVLNPMHHEGFAYVCSTPLYPDWPVFSMKDTPPAKAERLKKVLLSIPAGHPVLEKARNIENFIDALDYRPMEELCKLLGVQPFQTKK